MSRRKLIAALAVGSLCLATAVIVTGPSPPEAQRTAPATTPSTATNGGNNSEKQGISWDSAAPMDLPEPPIRP
jgi:hypothetical protein